MIEQVREAEKDSGEEEFFEQEAMAIAERKWKVAEAEWKRTQQNEFTRWANVAYMEKLGFYGHLKEEDKIITDLETDLSDGVKLTTLLEVLSGERLHLPNKKPNFRSQKLENVSFALEFLEREGVFLANINSADIVDCKVKPILSLMWALKRRYNIHYRVGIHYSGFRCKYIKVVDSIG